MIQLHTQSLYPWKDALVPSAETARVLETVLYVMVKTKMAVQARNETPPVTQSCGSATTRPSEWTSSNLSACYNAYTVYGSGETKVRGQLHTPVASPWGKSNPYTFSRRRGRSNSWSGHWRNKKSILTELFWLLPHANMNLQTVILLFPSIMPDWHVTSFKKQILCH